ncbi:MAG: hypothetical protein PHN98_04265 [Smithellaceae bacterium]|jgi:hypothetical protein|nr:hypothetical protein [Smithellaceae bacterium]
MDSGNRVAEIRTDIKTKGAKMLVRQKKFMFIRVIMLICLLLGNVVLAAEPPLKENACCACHKDYSKIMPKKHPEVGSVKACLSCHTPDPADHEPTNFSTEIHKVHKAGKNELKCAVCHSF